MLKGEDTMLIPFAILPDVSGDAMMMGAIGGSAILLVFSIISLVMRVRARDLRHLGTAAATEPLIVQLRPVFSRLAYIAGTLPQPAYRAWAARTIQHANLAREWTPELLMAVKLALGAAIFITGVPVAIILHIPWFLPVAGTIIGFFVPDILFYGKANERQEIMRRSLPFVIDLIAVSAEAGLAFQQAIRNVVDNSARGKSGDEKELLHEFELMLEGLQMGKSMSEALGDAARRVSLDEFNIFVNAILQAERLGTPVSEALKSQSQELRAKLSARIEAKANQAPVKILFPLIIFIFPVTAWVIIGPVLIRVFHGEG